MKSWAEWLAEGKPQLQLHINLLEPVGGPGLALLAATALQGIHDQVGLDLGAVWGVFQPNTNRDGIHAHAVIFGPPEFQQVRRDVVWAAVRERAKTLHRMVERPGEVPTENSAFVRLLPVVDRGHGPLSLTEYVTRYMLRYQDGAWFEVGELGRYLPERRC